MTDGEITSNAHVASTAADDVRVAHTRWWDALLHADVVVLESLLANDLTFHSPIGTTSTKAEFVERVRSGFLKYNSVAAEEPLIRLHGDTAIVTGRADIQFRAQGQPRSEGVNGHEVLPVGGHEISLYAVTSSVPPAAMRIPHSRESGWV